MRLIDWHTHPYYSQDAKGSVEAFVLQALKVGLESIALTTHIDLNPARDVIDNWMRVNGRLVRISNDAVSHYIAEVAEAQTKYLNEIKILLGFEFSYGKSFENRIAHFIEKYKPDVAIGSVHSLGNIGFTASKEVYFYKTAAPSGFLAKYCEKAADLVCSGLFSIVGHLDGYRKYLGAQWNGQLDDAEQRFFPPVFDEMAKRGVGVEVNTAAWRKGLDDFYPNKKLLEMAIKHGVRVVSLGSDAHRPKDVGAGIAEAKAFVKKMEVDIG